MKHLVCADIGACTLKLGSTDGARFASEPMPGKMIQAGTITAYGAMSEQLAQMTKKQRLGREAAVVLPAAKVYLRVMTMPVMGAEQMKINLPYEFREYMGHTEQEYVFDYAVMSVQESEDGEPQDMQVMSAAAPKSLISDYMEMFRKAGMKLVMAAPEEMGYCNLVRRYIEDHPDQAGDVFCFVDLGHAATRIHILKGAVYSSSRVIDVGGQDIDEAIANAKNIDVYLAHDYKESNHEGCQELDDCRMVYERIAVEVMRAVNFYSYNNEGQELTRLYLCGGSCEVRPLLDTIAQHNPYVTLADARQLYPQELEAADRSLTPAALGVALG